MRNFNRLRREGPRFAIRCLAFASFFCGLMACLAKYVPPVRQEIAFLESIDRKHDLLLRPREPSIVLVGGSGVAFGFDSEQLSQDLQRPVINAGLHAGLGIEFLLSDLESRLIEGDEVWLVFEYELYRGSARGSDTLAAMLIDVHSGSWENLMWSRRIALIDDALLYTARKSCRYIADAANQIAGRTVPWSGAGVYEASALNSFGDIAGHWGRESEVYLEPPIDEVMKVDEETLRRIQYFADRQRARNIQVRLWPPTIESEAFERQSTFVKALTKQLRAAGSKDPSALQWSAPPELMQTDRSNCYDSPYHLTRKGARQRGKKMTARWLLSR